MLSAMNKPIMLSVFMLSVIMLSVIMLSVVILSVSMLSVVMLSVNMPNVMAPHWSLFIQSLNVSLNIPKILEGANTYLPFIKLVTIQILTNQKVFKLDWI
jgi:hypothetical protein